MKKLLFFMSFFLFVGISAQAQSCSKTCTKAKTTTTDASEKASDTKVAAAYMEADKIASANENIEKRECAVSGTVSYFEKSTCAVSGKVTWEEVEFDSEAKKFTKVASASMEKDPATGEVKVKKECTPEEKAKCAAACAAKCKTKASKA